MREREVKIAKREKIRFVDERNGEIIEVLAPKSAAVRDFEEAYNEAAAKKGPVIRISDQFMLDCGLPKEFIDELGFEGRQQVLEALMPQKKT
jgi:hypothetical protein